MEFGPQTYSIIPVYQGQRGFSLFLMVDQGRDLSMPLLITISHHLMLFG
jgi:hypothetical protein